MTRETTATLKHKDRPGFPASGAVPEHDSPKGNRIMQFAICSPDTPQQVEDIFHAVRNNQDVDQDHAHTASLVHQAVESKLQSKYGHESPVDWYDLPEATILAVGAAAAQRITEYTPDKKPAVNERTQQWHLALKAYALCRTDPDDSNKLLHAVSQHGQYENTITFMPDEV